MPVRNATASDARNATTSATSRGVPSRPTAVPRRCARTRPCCPLFFLVLFSTIDGIRDVNPDLIESLEIMGASRFEIATKLIIPAAKPWTFTGMRISVRYATTAAILGEVIAANRGIGFLIEYNSGQFNAAGVFAAVLILVLVGVVVTELLTRLERGSAPAVLPF